MVGLVDVHSIATQHNISDIVQLSASGRTSLIVVNIIFISLGLGLNSCVIISGLKHVMHLDKVTQMFILNIAISDVVIVIVSFCPMVMTLIYDRWVLGPTICFLSAHFFQKIPFINELLMITSMSCYRLWMLKQPQSVRENIRTSRVILFMSAVLFVSVCPTIASLAINNYAKFDPHTLNCVISNTEPGLYISYSLGLVFIFLVIPMLVVLVSNIALLNVVFRFSRKSGKLPHRMTIVTILCVCGVFLLSYVPSLVGLVLRSVRRDVIPPWYNILFNQINSIDVVANPFIYTLTNHNFREFMRALFSSQHSVFTQSRVVLGEENVPTKARRSKYKQIVENAV